MPEEVMKEAAATSEPPRGVASPEFFFLLQRIDRLDEKFIGEINSVRGEVKAVESKLSEEIKTESRRLDEKLDKLRFWSVGTVVAVVVGFAGTIVALVVR